MPVGLDKDEDTEKPGAKNASKKKKKKGRSESCGNMQAFLLMKEDYRSSSDNEETFNANQV